MQMYHRFGCLRCSKFCPLSGFCPDFPSESVCPDSVCLNSVCLDSVREFRKKCCPMSVCLIFLSRFRPDKDETELSEFSLSLSADVWVIRNDRWRFEIVRCPLIFGTKVQAFTGWNLARSGSALRIRFGLGKTTMRLGMTDTFTDIPRKFRSSKSTFDQQVLKYLALKCTCGDKRD